MKRITILLLLLLSVNLLFAQLSKRFYHLDVSQGLSNNRVNCIYKDTQGYIWIGTTYGLNRYDGYNFKHYFSDTENKGLWSNNISNIQEDGNGNLWLKLKKSYVIYKRNNDQFEKNYSLYLNKLGIFTQFVLYVYTDNDKNLWVADNNMTYYYNFKTQTVRKFKFNNVNDIKVYDNTAYIIQQNGLLILLDLKTNSIKQDNTLMSLGSNSLGRFVLYIDSQKEIWIYSNFAIGLYHYTPTLNKWKYLGVDKNAAHIISGSQIKAVIDDRMGNVWIATDHFGINIFSRKEQCIIQTIKYEQKEFAVKSNSINNLFIDNNNIIWIAYSKKGISFTTDFTEKFKSFTVPGNHKSEYQNDISSILVNKKGDLWIGTDGDGATRIEKGTNIATHYTFKNNVVVCQFEDTKGRIWLGTFRDGLYCYSGGQMIHYKQGENGLADDNIWAIQEDNFGNIWIGGLNSGIQRLNMTTQKFEKPLLKVCVLSFSRKDYWLYAGTPYGYLKINTLSLEYDVVTTNKKKSQNFPDLTFQCVYCDSRGLIWFGGSKGLSVYDEVADTIYSISQKEGLCNNVIQGITEDNKKQMWVTTENGLAQLNVVQKKQEYSFRINNYHEKDGLLNTSYSERAITTDKNGYVYVGGSNGYTIIYSNRIKKNTFKPKVIFTDIQIDNEVIRINTPYKGRIILDKEIYKCDRITLNYSDNQVSIFYSAMDYTSPENCKYAYSLESGMRTNWSYTNSNKITFTNMSPGDYVLKMKACNSNGVWNDEISTLRITIRPPFWFSGLAYFIYLILIIAFVYYFYKRTQYRHNAKLHMHKMAMELEKQHHMNDMKLQFFTNISHDFRTPLSLIISPLEKIIEDNEESTITRKLKVVYKNALQLTNLVNQLLDFRKLGESGEVVENALGDYIGFAKDICNEFSLYKNDKNIKLQFVSKQKNFEFSFDKEKVRKIVMNLLSNAFKFSPEQSTIVFEVEIDETNISTSIKDNGIGIPDKDKKKVFDRFYQIEHSHLNYGNGIGLHIVSEYIALLKGTVSLQDNQPQGCIFTFTLPIKNEDALFERQKVDLDQDIQESEDNIEDKRPAILIVEDNNEFRTFIVECLNQEFKTRQAGNGESALKILDTEQIDVVISDIMMPVMDGLELCYKIKSNINLSHIPVILLTARTADEHKLEGLREGADEYITKPFNLKILKLRIEKVLQWKLTRHEIFRKKAEIKVSEITISSLDELFIEKAIKIVENNMGNFNFSVEDLSSAMGVSRGHLYNKLMNITGKAPLEFIRLLRLKRSKQYIAKSQMNISEIAYAVGFNTPKVFSTYFKLEFGKSPREYKNSSENKNNTGNTESEGDMTN